MHPDQKQNLLSPCIHLQLYSMQTGVNTVAFVPINHFQTAMQLASLPRLTSQSKQINKLDIFLKRDITPPAHLGHLIAQPPCGRCTRFVMSFWLTSPLSGSYLWWCHVQVTITRNTAILCLSLASLGHKETRKFQRIPAGKDPCCWH